VKLATLVAAALLALSALPTRAAEPAPAAPAKEKAATAKAVIPVKGMHCGGCVSHVNEAVQKLDGVKSVNTDLEKARTTVVFDPARVKPEQIVAAIAETGYEPGKPKLAK
jgi:copper ion binding protein